MKAAVATYAFWVALLGGMLLWQTMGRHECHRRVCPAGMRGAYVAGECFCAPEAKEP